ncbi:MAG: hypothetical protein ACK50M_09020 [Cyclobacteriaceae bacterium]
MKSKSIIAAFLIVIVATVSCDEIRGDLNRVDDLNTMDDLAVGFNRLLSQKAIHDFIKEGLRQKDVQTVFLSLVEPAISRDQMALANDISNNLFKSQKSDSKNKETEYFAISSAVSEMSNSLTSRMETELSISANLSESPDQVTARLQSIINEFRSNVLSNNSLTFDESRALISFADFETASIHELVNLVYSIDSSSGGRAKGWFRNLLSAIVTAVVAAVVVVTVVVTGGAAAVAAGAYISAATWGTMIAAGAIVGGVYGAAVGYDLASRGYYFTDFDPGNVGQGFLEWEQCTGNPGHWACI